MEILKRSSSSDLFTVFKPGVEKGPDDPVFLLVSF
jgi:hypothetical protein